MAYEHVLSPLTLNGLTLKNRVARTAHGTNMGGGTIGDDLIAYHAARARGGCGLSILEVMSVHPTSAPGPLNFGEPNLARGYAKLIDACRPHGMALMQQIWHPGHHGFPLDGSPPWSASPIPSVTEGVVPIEMTKTQIDTIVDAFAETARFCDQSGLDGIEVHAAHGYLIQQFFSPLTNQRRDDYGGSLENRMRFGLEVMRAVRARVRPGFVIAIRLSADGAAGGIGPDDNIRFVEVLEGEGLIDLLNVSYGSYLAFHLLIGAMHQPVGYELPTATPVTRRAKTPSLVTGRFRTLAEANAVIARGDAALVGMTRAHLADPDIVVKTMAGREAEIRPCIGCNQGCVGELLGGSGRTGCTVNPAAGYERTLSEDVFVRAPAPRRVLVVGGGPAGLEAARVAALRGHAVTLCEAQGKLGGTVETARQAPHHGLVGDAVDWLAREVNRLSVDVRLNTRLDAESALALRPDAVIVATGSRPRLDGWQSARPGEPARGIEQAHVVSTEALFAGARNQLGTHAFVFDDVGAYEAIGAAEWLLEKGLTVTFATRHNAFAHRLEGALVAEPALQRLRRSGRFTLMTRAHLKAIGEADVEVGYLDGGPSAHVPADTVVFVSLNMPERSIASTLKERGLEVHLVGDANSPRFLPTAFKEARRAGMAV